MKNVIRAIFGTIAAALLALIVVPAFASAQVGGAQLVILTQTQSPSPVPAYAIPVTVNAAGPSLTGVPSNTGTLTYNSSFNNETRVITMVPGNYSVSLPTTSGYAFQYTNCSGVLSAGETRTCTITATAGGTSYVNVSVNVQNRYGGTRTANDFVITVSGQNPSVSSIQGSVGSTQISMGPGSYSINVGMLGSYNITRSEGCFGTIGVGETRSCVLTLSDYGYGAGGTYYPLNQLTCSPANQTVLRGATASFVAQGGVGTYTWATADRVYLNIGPSLNTQLISSGSQAVYVTSGSQTATCYVTVLPSGSVLGASTQAPGLPNTGFGSNAWSTLLALLAAFVALPAAAFALYPHAKRTAATFLG